MITAALFAVAVQNPAMILIFTKTAGYRHDSIETGVAAITELLKPHHTVVRVTDDPEVFNEPFRKEYSAVVFLSTTGDILNAKQELALQEYVTGGGGFVGIHAAADTEYDWPFYGKLVGAYFKSHPRIQDALVKVVDRSHPSTKHLPANWARKDEWYCYRSVPAAGVKILAKLDATSYEGSVMGEDHPIAWCHDTLGGRSWYTGGGHTKESYAEPAFREHLLGGILWAMNHRD